MNIGILCAMDEELLPIKNEMENIDVIKYIKWEVITGYIKGEKVFIICSGVGKVNAALAIQALLQVVSIDIVIATGLSGGLEPSIHIGDIVVAEQLIYHDCFLPALKGASSNYGSKHLSVPFRTLPYILDAVMTSLQQCSLQFQITIPHREHMVDSQVLSGVVLTGDRPVFDEKEISAQLISEYKALCVDMESAAVYQACEQFKISCIAIRFISDIVSRSSPLQILRYKDSVCKYIGKLMGEFIPIIAKCI